MRTGPVARNYAEALFAVAELHGEVDRYGALVEAVAGAVETAPALKAALESPRLPKERKRLLLRRALEKSAPAPFIRFLDAVVQRGRQGLLTAVSREYEELSDEHFNRVHAGVTTARPVDDALAAGITESLSRVAGKTVLPHFRTDPRILGGVVVRIGDRVFDGSLRRRLAALRYRMLHARIGGGA